VVESGIPRIKFTLSIIGDGGGYTLLLSYSVDGREKIQAVWESDE
jgi:hypothetical protein